MFHVLKITGQLTVQEQMSFKSVCATGLTTITVEGKTRTSLQHTLILGLQYFIMYRRSLYM